jgi:hypothetical protein
VKTAVGIRLCLPDERRAAEDVNGGARETDRALLCRHLAVDLARPWLRRERRGRPGRAQDRCDQESKEVMMSAHK